VARESLYLGDLEGSQTIWDVQATIEALSKTGMIPIDMAISVARALAIAATTMSERALPSTAHAHGRLTLRAFSLHSPPTPQPQKCLVHEAGSGWQVYSALALDGSIIAPQHVQRISQYSFAPQVFAPQVTGAKAGLGGGAGGGATIGGGAGLGEHPSNNTAIHARITPPSWPRAPPTARSASPRPRARPRASA